MTHFVCIPRILTCNLPRHYQNIKKTVNIITPWPHSNRWRKKFVGPNSIKTRNPLRLICWYRYLKYPFTKPSFAARKVEPANDMGWYGGMMMMGWFLLFCSFFYLCHWMAVAAVWQTNIFNPMGYGGVSKWVFYLWWDFHERQWSIIMVLCCWLPWLSFCSVLCA